MVELTLVVRVQVSHPKGVSMGELVLKLVCCVVMPPNSFSPPHGMQESWPYGVRLGEQGLHLADYGIG